MIDNAVNVLLGIAIQLLGKLIPALGGFLGGPLGFIAGIAISWLSGILSAMIERYTRNSKIEGQAAGDLADLIAKKAALDGAQEADREKARADFLAAASKLGRIRL